MLSFLAFAQAVRNTSRVPRLAAPGYQVRFQSLTSMAFPIGDPLGALLGGEAVDQFGLKTLIAGSGILVVISLPVVFGR